MSALPNDQASDTVNAPTAKQQLAQFRCRVSKFGTSNEPTIDRYLASCRGWAKALAATSGACHEGLFRNGALPQEEFIRAAREIFEPRITRLFGELLETSCDEPFFDQVADRCDDVTKAIAQLERAWTPSSLASQQQVIPAMNAVENALKRLEPLRSILAKRSPSAPLITAAVAANKYHVTRRTLSRALHNGRLTDHRKPEHSKNATLKLCENEVAMHWPPR